MRIVRRACLGAATIVFLVPLSSILFGSGVSWSYRASVVALWTVALTRISVPALATIVPLGLLWATLLSVASPTAVVETAALTFASAMMVRAALSPSTPTMLGPPALVLGAAVVTSTLTELFTQRAVAPNRPFFAELWHHLTATYWTEEAGNWIVVHDAFRWVSLLTVAVCAERLMRLRQTMLPIALWLWLVAAAIATSFTFVRVAEVISTQQSDIVSSLAWLVTHVRLSVLHADPNAAGSIFGWLAVTSILVALARRRWWALVLVSLPLLLAFGLAQSRAAVGALAVVLIARWVIPRFQLQRSFMWPVIASVAIVVLLWGWMATSRSHAVPSQALLLRYQMTLVGLKMAARFPVFGVGLGDYARTSQRFITTDLPELASFARRGENAHNNFLQVFVELGIVGGLSFLWLVVPPARAGWKISSLHFEPEHQGLAIGLSAFLLSAFFGHPLLIPEVLAMFCVGLALTAAHAGAPGPTAHDRRSIVAVAGVSLLVVSLFWRLN